MPLLHSRIALQSALWHQMTASKHSIAEMKLHMQSQAARVHTHASIKAAPIPAACCLLHHCAYMPGMIRGCLHLLASFCASLPVSLTFSAAFSTRPPAQNRFLDSSVKNPKSDIGSTRWKVLHWTVLQQLQLVGIVVRQQEGSFIAQADYANSMSKLVQRGCRMAHLLPHQM